MSVLFGACQGLGWASSKPRLLRSTTTTSGYWIARSSRAMTPRVWEQLPKSRATVSLCDAFPWLFKVRNESRTNRGRIADSRLSPVPFTQHLAGRMFDRTRWSFGLSHKRRFDGGFLKIGDGAESNQNREGGKW